MVSRFLYAMLLLCCCKVECFAQDASFSNATISNLKIKGGANDYSGWGYNTDYVTDLRPNLYQGLAYLMHNHYGLTFSAHSTYGGIRFYNQGYPGGPLNTSTGARMVMSINAGNVGVGTAFPRYKLEVISEGNTGTVSAMIHGQYHGALVTTQQTTASYHAFEVRTGTNSTGSEGSSAFFIRADGNIGIGTRSPGTNKLAVEGTVAARKVKVTQSNPWPDYVFEPTYRLPTLPEVEAFIKQNKHLPGVPSANEVEQNGLDLGNNQAVLLKKIEELTLYVIELKKENDALKFNFEDRFRKLEGAVEILQNSKSN